VRVQEFVEIEGLVAVEHVIDSKGAKGIVSKKRNKIPLNYVVQRYGSGRTDQPCKL
jgi:hypothetical protein